MFEWRGTVWDAEAFAGKGVGSASLEPAPGLSLDVFTTHTISDSGTTMANNTWYRVKQVEEIMREHVGREGSKREKRASKREWSSRVSFDTARLNASCRDIRTYVYLR